MFESCFSNRDDRIRNATLLVFSNKVDLPGSCSTAQITDKLGLHSHKGRDWYIQVITTSCSTAQITDKLGLHSHKGRDWYIQVITTSCSTAQITDKLGLRSHKGRDWYIQVSSTTRC